MAKRLSPFSACGMIARIARLFLAGIGASMALKGFWFMRCWIFLACVTLVVAMVAGDAYGAEGPGGAILQCEQVSTGFLNKTMTVNGRTRHYVLYVPRDYEADKPWPLVVFLHGIGERGSDGLSQSQVGIGSAIRFHPDRFPCLVVMPQCPAKVTWEKAVEDIDVAISDTLEDYNVDADRVYLTGLSMGGYAAWQYGAMRADMFAAIMPVCGGGRVKDAERLARIPVWAFHGSEDDVVPPKESRKMVEAIKKAGGDIRYTEYEGVAHNSWDRAYGEKKAIEWLLKQRRTAAQTK